MIRERLSNVFGRVGGFASSISERANSAIENMEVSRGFQKGHTMHRVSELALLTPRFMRLILSLMGDRRVPLRTKVAAGATMAYIVSPIDLIPEIILGPLGMVDDVIVVILALHILINGSEPAVVREHWRGDEDILEIIQDALGFVENIIPDRAQTIYKGWIKG